MFQSQSQRNTEQWVTTYLTYTKPYYQARLFGKRLDPNSGPSTLNCASPLLPTITQQTTRQYVVVHLNASTGRANYHDDCEPHGCVCSVPDSKHSLSDLKLASSLLPKEAVNHTAVFINRRLSPYSWVCKAKIVSTVYAKIHAIANSTAVFDQQWDPNP